MDDRVFRDMCQRVVAEYANEYLDKTDESAVAPEDVYIVWSCKTLQNAKALASTSLNDGMYYELTYNGDKQELYLDVYQKLENRAIEVEVK